MKHKTSTSFETIVLCKEKNSDKFRKTNSRLSFLNVSRYSSNQIANNKIIVPNHSVFAHL